MCVCVCVCVCSLGHVWKSGVESILPLHQEDSGDYAPAGRPDDEHLNPLSHLVNQLLLIVRTQKAIWSALHRLQVDELKFKSRSLTPN